MIQNDLKLALRQILKDRQTALLHFTGLSLGIGVCFLMTIWVHDELRYDRFHSQADRIYRALWEARFGDNEWKIAQCPVPLAPLLAREFPEVERATQCSQGGMTFKKGPDYVREPLGLLVDEQFGAVFDLDYVAGDPNTALQSPDGIVLTEKTARRYFGNSEALGQTIARNDGKLFRVNGVVRDWPAQSHLHFDYLVSLKNNPSVEQRKDQWGSATVLTYFLLKPGAGIAAAEAKMKAYVAKNLMVDEMAKGSNFTSFPFQRLTDIHLRSDFEASAGHGHIRYVWVFSIIAAAMLALACINFVNLATARALTRAREVGVRKALGSTRSQLVRQFFAESFVNVSGGIAGALLLVLLALPAFNRLSGKELQADILLSPFAIALLIVLALVTTLVAGAFPAFFLSAFTPANVLKNNITAGGSGRSRLRQTLVVAQFCISTALIIGAMVVQKQLHFIQNQQLGFQKEQVLVLKRASGLAGNYGVFFERLRAMTGVESATAGQFMPGKGFDSTIFLPEQPANYEETSLNYNFVDAHFVPALGLRLKAGKDFRPGVSSDSAGCIINETAARRLGWADPVGKTLTMGGNPPGKVLGVVEDFHFQSLHHVVEPMVIKLGRWPLSYAAIRLSSGDIPAQIARIQALWKELAPSVPFDYSFLDQDFQKLYDTEMRMSEVFSLFSGMAIFIACLGLFGLASFMTQRRTKEIGIRKVLGASAAGITGLLAKDFLKPVVLAILLAGPLAYYLMDKWLADFAYRIDIQWWVFAVAGAGAVAVALLTVGFESVRAALANPVRSLRSE